MIAPAQVEVEVNELAVSTGVDVSKDRNSFISFPKCLFPFCLWFRDARFKRVMWKCYDNDKTNESIATSVSLKFSSINLQL